MSTPDPANPARHLSDVARAAIASDYWFILSYVAALLLSLASAVRSMNATARHGRAEGIANGRDRRRPLVVCGAFCDLAENRLMTFQLDPAQPLVPGLPAGCDAPLASLAGPRAAGLAERRR